MLYLIHDDTIRLTPTFAPETALHFVPVISPNSDPFWFFSSASIIDIEREEMKVKTQIKQLAKRGDMSGVKCVPDLTAWNFCLFPLYHVLCSEF